MQSAANENNWFEKELLLTLALLVLGILANYADASFSFNDFAFVANRFN